MKVVIGTAALVHDKTYVGTPPDLFALDLTVWGWAQMLREILSRGRGSRLLGAWLSAA
jgi:hypothetical protein